MYSKTVMDHFKNPRNVGEIQGADGVGEAGNPICGDMMKITIKVDNDRIKGHKIFDFWMWCSDCRFQHGNRNG